MKTKFIIILIALLLSSGYYVSATAVKNSDLTNAEPITYNANNDDTLWQSRMGRGSSSIYYDATIEQHQQIVAKKVELVNHYFSNYSELTIIEKEEAELNYHTDLQTFVEQLLNTDVNMPYFDEGSSFMYSQFDEESKELIIIKNVELVNKYLSNYESLTDEEKQLAEYNYHNELRLYKRTLMDDYGNCYRNGGDSASSRRQRRRGMNW